MWKSIFSSVVALLLVSLLPLAAHADEPVVAPEPGAMLSRVSDGERITEVQVAPDGTQTVITYPDFAAIEQRLSEEPVDRNSINEAKKGTAGGCKYTATSAAITWTNCRIQAKNYRVSMGYRLNASRVRNQSAKITKVWDKQSASFLGSLQHVSFGIQHAGTTARYQVMWTGPWSLGSATMTLGTTITKAGSLQVSLY